MKKRGLRRYYKKLATRNPVLDLLHNREYQNFGYDYEHIHINDYVLTRWKEIKAHIEALCRQLKLVKDYINECPPTFQMWGYVCFQREYGCQVILYMHTPNGDANGYPADFSNFSSIPTITKSEISNYFQSKIKDGFNLYYSINCDNEPEILISHSEIGEPIITVERKEEVD